MTYGRPLGCQLSISHMARTQPYPVARRVRYIIIFNLSNSALFLSGESKIFLDLTNWHSCRDTGPSDFVEQNVAKCGGDKQIIVSDSSELGNCLCLPLWGNTYECRMKTVTNGGGQTKCDVLSCLLGQDSIVDEMNACSTAKNG